jgi:hypothetical protein
MLKSMFRQFACASALAGMLCAHPAFASPSLAKRLQCPEATSSAQAGHVIAICTARRS